MNFHSPGTGKKRKIDVQCTNIRWALPHNKKVNHANNVRVNRKDRKGFIHQWDAQDVINQFANIAGKMDITMIIIGLYLRKN